MKRENKREEGHEGHINDVKGGTQGVQGAELDEVRAKLEAKVAELTNDLQRTRADFENFRKQIEVREMSGKKMVKNATVAKFLPLLDDIDRAVGSYEELKPLEGSLKKTMQELGLVKMEMGEGTEFDPELAEAVMAEGEGEKEVIGEVLRPGYYYENEVLRPAMVKVRRM